MCKAKSHQCSDNPHTFSRWLQKGEQPRDFHVNVLPALEQECLLVGTKKLFGQLDLIFLLITHSQKAPVISVTRENVLANQLVGDCCRLLIVTQWNWLKSAMQTRNGKMCLWKGAGFSCSQHLSVNEFGVLDANYEWPWQSACNQCNCKDGFGATHSLQLFHAASIQ